MYKVNFQNLLYIKLFLFINWIYKINQKIKNIKTELATKHVNPIINISSRFIWIMIDDTIEIIITQKSLKFFHINNQTKYSTRL